MNTNPRGCSEEKKSEPQRTEKWIETIALVGNRFSCSTGQVVFSLQKCESWVSNLDYFQVCLGCCNTKIYIILLISQRRGCEKWILQTRLQHTYSEKQENRPSFPGTLFTSAVFKLLLECPTSEAQKVHNPPPPHFEISVISDWQEKLNWIVLKFPNAASDLQLSD